MRYPGLTHIHGIGRDVYLLKTAHKCLGQGRGCKEANSIHVTVMMTSKDDFSCLSFVACISPLHQVIAICIYLATLHDLLDLEVRTINVFQVQIDWMY